MLRPKLLWTVSLIFLACSGGGNTSGDHGPEPSIVAIAQRIQAQKLLYSSHPADLQDCSGIFHRALEALRKECPDFVGPRSDQARSTRSLGRWFAEHRQWVLVQDALKQDDLIEPGVVLFYGRQGQRYRKVTRKKVFAEIAHMGIVTTVERDASGRVTSYRLFHGRSPGKPAAITAYHTRIPTRRSYPPLGNGNQQWIAAAWLCRGASCDCVNGEGTR